MSWQYYGLFLDNNTRNKLLEFVNNYEGTKEAMKIANKIYLDHCTLLHKSQCDAGSTKVLNTLLLLSSNYTTEMIITHIGISRKAIAFKVTNIENLCANEIPHITIATFDNGKPVDSNNIKSWFELEESIKIVGTLKKV